MSYTRFQCHINFATRKSVILYNIMLLCVSLSLSFYISSTAHCFIYSLSLKDLTNDCLLCLDNILSNKKQNYKYIYLFSLPMTN